MTGHHYHRPKNYHGKLLQQVVQVSIFMQRQHMDIFIKVQIMEVLLLYHIIHNSHGKRCILEVVVILFLLQHILAIFTTRLILESIGIRILLHLNYGQVYVSQMLSIISLLLHQMIIYSNLVNQWLKLQIGKLSHVITKAKVTLSLEMEIFGKVLQVFGPLPITRRSNGRQSQ